MKGKRHFFVAVAFAMILSGTLNSEMMAPYLSSEKEYADTLAQSVWYVLSCPDADIDRGVMLASSGPVTLAGRTMTMQFETLGDLGWPTVIQGMTITFNHDNGSVSEPFHYTFTKMHPQPAV